MHPKLVYIALTKQLMFCLGDNDDEMFMCDIDEKMDDIKYECRSYKLKMPHESDEGLDGALIALDDVLIIFYFQESDYTHIYCSDVLQSQAIKDSDKIIDTFIFWIFAIKNIGKRMHMSYYQNH